MVGRVTPVGRDDLRGGVFALPVSPNSSYVSCAFLPSKPARQILLVEQEPPGRVPGPHEQAMLDAGPSSAAPDATATRWRRFLSYATIACLASERAETRRQRAGS